MHHDSYRAGLKLAQSGRHAEAIEAFEAALARKPDDAPTLFALAATARTLGMSSAARRFYGRVLEIEPERIEALVGLANLLREEGQAEAARQLALPALARAPQSPELLVTLGLAEQMLGYETQAEERFRAALAARPDFAPALGNLADALSLKGDHDGALALYDRLLAKDNGNAQARLNRAILHFLKADLKAAWRDYAARLKLPAKAPRTDHRLKAWTGGSLKNTRLLVSAEQGVGDQIMFASLIPDLCARARAEGGRIILESEPRLAPLFARSFLDVRVAEADWIGRNGGVEARYGWLKPLGGANAAVELGTLARYLRGDLADFPAPHTYLVPEPAELARWRDWAQALGGARRVGICWRSGKLTGGRAQAYAPLEAWGQFLREISGELVCVQYDAHSDELAALENLSGRTIHAPPGLDQKQELDRTAAMLSALDIVVSAPTAVSWLSAGLGVPTVKLVRDTCWTAFGRSFEPFAPAARIVGCDRPGDWAQGFSRLKMLV